MSTPPDLLQRVSAPTLAHYGAQAEAFWAGTRDHDVSQNIEALLGHIEGPAPFTLLDFGCGPGRDLVAFSRLGHRAIGLEGTPAFVEMARQHSGCEVWQQNFLALDLPPAFFDGIFANASLFHVPGADLPRVLRQLHDALKPRGILLSSNPIGQDEEGWANGRYGVFHDPASWCAHLQAAGFEACLQYFRPPGVPRAQQRWFAGVWRKA
ncbi:MAG: class I SAM-dependent methyltransferase [Aquabacterium sp.]